MVAMNSKDYRNMVRGKRSKAIGKEGEAKAARALRGLGFVMLEGIGTPVKIVETKIDSRKKKWYRIIWGEKVSADHNAMLPDGTGRRVLIEVKTVEGEKNLIWSQFEDHQPGRLTMNEEYGGISLVVWVRFDFGEVYIMRWRELREAGFRHGKGCTPEMARELELRAWDELLDE